MDEAKDKDKNKGDSAAESQNELSKVFQLDRPVVAHRWSDDISMTVGVLGHTKQDPAGFLASSDCLLGDCCNDEVCEDFLDCCTYHSMRN